MVRRTLPPDEKRSKLTWLCLTPPEWEALVKLSQATARSRSSILRDALRVYLVEQQRREVTGNVEENQPKK